MESARSLYAKALDDLGLKKSGAKDELISARDAATKAAGTPSIADEANNLLAQINTKLDELNSATRVRASDSQAFSLNSKPVDTIAVGANIFAITENGAISKYDTRAKTAESYGQVEETLGKILAMAYNDSENALYFLSDKPTVVRLDITSKSVKELKTAEGSTWEKAVGIATYSNNIYLLDSAVGQIWKHTAGDQTYSKGTAYVSKQPVSLKDTKDIAIDGNVYVLKADGGVLKVSKGAEDTNYSISGVPTPDTKIVAPKAISAAADTNSIYILDAATNRLVQFSKVGAFQKQYVFDGMQLNSYAVNEKLKKIWLCSESKVFEIDL